MSSLARFILRGPLQAIAFVSVVGLAALLPLLNVLAVVSAGALALVVFAVGERQGLLVVVGSTALVAVVGLFVIGDPTPGLLLALTLWLPAWILAYVWRLSGSLAYTVQTATLLGVLAVLALDVSMGDPAAFWQGRFEDNLMPALGPLLERGVFGPNPQLVLETAARWMNGVMAALLTLMLVLGSFLARYWIGVVYNTAGLRAEFHRLNLGRTAALMGVVVAVAALATDRLMVDHFLLVVAVAFVLQGLAVAHALVAAGLHRGWLIGLYAVIALIPHAAVLIAVVGLLDGWFDFRSHVPSR